MSYFASNPSGVCAARNIAVLTAVNRQLPQQIWPQGVKVAFVGAKKHIGQVYSARGVCLGGGAGEAGSGAGVREAARCFPFALIEGEGGLSTTPSPMSGSVSTSAYCAGCSGTSATVRSKPTSSAHSPGSPPSTCVFPAEDVPVSSSSCAACIAAILRDLLDCRGRLADLCFRFLLPNEDPAVDALSVRSMEPGVDARERERELVAERAARTRDAARERGSRFLLVIGVGRGES